MNPRILSWCCWRSPSGAITAPASLKRDVCPGHQRRGEGPSGAITAPASLKRRARRRSLRRAPAAIRGDYCPGLIEAGACGQDYIFLLRGPSGAITAPASLKRGPSGACRMGEGAIRGDYCPGLIEARRCGTASTGGGFPSGAITAPASLKPVQGARLCVRGQTPSGAITAPASLKQNPFDRISRLRSVTIRGDYCPGLIEAPKLRLRRRRFLANHPGRLLPRPH